MKAKINTFLSSTEFVFNAKKSESKNCENQNTEREKNTLIHTQANI